MAMTVMAAPQSATYEDEYNRIRDEAADILDAPDTWLDTENDQFYGKKPKDWIEEGRADFVSDQIKRIKYGQLG